MRSIEYRRWDPVVSPVCVEFPAELLLELGWAETSGILYGSRRGREIRIAALGTPLDEEQEKVGVFVSRIRGEVFLTEADLAFLNRHRAELALVVAGKQAGFFVRESGGAIQTVRSHEEFSIPRPASANPMQAAAGPHPASGKRRKSLPRKYVPQGALAAALLVLAVGAAAVFAQRTPKPPRGIEVHETDHQLQITWQPAQNAVLAIDDSGGHLAIPVYADQSNVTYVPRGSEVEVSLLSVDAKNRLHRVSAHYVRAIPDRSIPDRSIPER